MGHGAWGITRVRRIVSSVVCLTQCRCVMCGDCLILPRASSHECCVPYGMMVRNSGDTAPDFGRAELVDPKFWSDF